MSNPIALFCGVPPCCDRCAEADAVARITLPTYGVRALCGKCLTELVELGLNQGKEEKHWIEGEIGQLVYDGKLPKTSGL